MIHRITIEWDDKENDEAPTWADFLDVYILDEMHGCIDDMDLSAETINRAHMVLNKVILHLNQYVVEIERKEE